LTAFESGSVLRPTKKPELELQAHNAKLRIFLLGMNRLRGCIPASLSGGLEATQGKQTSTAKSEWRLKDLADKHKRLEPPAAMNWNSRAIYSTLLRDARPNPNITETAGSSVNRGEGPDVFVTHPHGALARSIVVLWSSSRKRGCAGEKESHPEVPEFLIGEASARLE